MILDGHLPSRNCDCPECVTYFTTRAYSNLRPATNLQRMQAERRPHLHDAAFLKFMGKVVGDTLRSIR